MPVRIAAAHALFRLACLPAAAQDHLCSMLLDADPNARKVALLAFTPFAKTAAGAIARHVAATDPARWTVEALRALVESAGDDRTSQGKIEAFVMRSLAGAPLVPAGIAGYACLARLNPQGAAIGALVQVAADAANPQASGAALEALGQLGESARPAATRIAQMLAATDDPAREELLCRTLLRLRSPAKDVPIARVLQRVQSAPDRSTAAHCMLLCLHPKEFGQAATVVRQRGLAAGDALQKALAQTYKTLTGTELMSSTVPGKG
jgi:predicted nucleic acid-binding protein